MASPRKYGGKEQRSRHVRPTDRQSRSPSPNTRIASECVPRQIPILPDFEEFETSKKKAPPSYHQPFHVHDTGCATPRHVWSTHYSCPYAYKTLMQTGLSKSLGVIFQPLAEIPPDETEIPVIEHEGDDIIRCNGCRGYLNAYCQWLQSGHEWRCPMCGSLNPTPSWFYCNTDTRFQRLDKDQRGELSRGVVDYIAPKLYCRQGTLKSINFLFVVDVSTLSLENGMAESAFLYLAHYLETTFIDSEDSARDSSVRFGLLTYSDTVEFHDIYKKRLYEVSDVDNPFAPIPTDIVMVPVKKPENEGAEEKEDPLQMFIDYLKTLRDIYKETTTRDSCFGSAAYLAFETLKSIGGKALLFQAHSPSIGVGRLPNPGASSNDIEFKELTEWYGEFSTEAAKEAVSFDLFCNASHGLNLATVHSLVDQTGGNIFYYKNYNDVQDREALERNIEKVLMRYQAIDCSIAIRTSTGVDVNTIITNGIVDENRNIILSHINDKTTISATLMVNIDQTGRKFCIVQYAMLHTPINEVPLVRVITLALPVSRAATEIFRTSHLDTVSCMITRIAMAQVLNPATSTTIETGRKLISTQCTECLYRYRRHCAPRSSSGQLILPEQLKTLPLFALGAMKCPLFAKQLPQDERIYLMNRFLYTSLIELTFCYYPRLHRLDTIDSHMLVWMEDNGFTKPPICPLNRKQITSEGLYILNNGVNIYFCIGEDVEPYILEMFQEREDGTLMLTEDLAEDPESLLGRIQALVDEWRYQSSIFLPIIVLNRPNNNSKRTANKDLFYGNLIEEASRRNTNRELRKNDQFHMSYIDFLVFCHGAIRKLYAATR